MGAPLGQETPVYLKIVPHGLAEVFIFKFVSPDTVSKDPRGIYAPSYPSVKLRSMASLALYASGG